MIDDTTEAFDVAGFVRDWLSLNHAERVDGARHFSAATQLALELHHNPWIGWLLIALVAASTSDARLLANIGAGPLEDLISGYPEPFAELVASEVRRNASLRRALSSVWVCKHYVSVQFLALLESACPEFKGLTECGCNEAGDEVPAST